MKAKFYLVVFLFQLIMLWMFFAPECGAASAGSWVWVRNTVTGTYGEAVVGTGAALFIARGSSFYRYTPSNNSFVELASPPKPDGDAFKTGTALAWDFGDYIYVLYGAATGDSRRYFYRYSISLNLWERLADTPYDQGEGDAITYVGRIGIYATVGGEQRPTHFLFYNVSLNVWDDAPADPGGMGDGASLVWAGGDCLYALRGEFLEDKPLCDFWLYNLTANVWSSLADIPAYPHDGGVGGVGDGGSLLYIGFWMPNQTDYIYALSGNQAYPDGIPDNRTYRYKISTNSWERLADLPFGVGYYVGCRLGYADGHIYAWQGTPSTWNGGGDDLARYEFPTTIDLSINATIQPPKIYYGQNATMIVNVKNEGDIDVENPVVNIRFNYLANFNLTLHGVIEPGKFIRQIFFIVTTGGSAGLEPIRPGNYTIRIEVYPIEGEVDLNDNIYILSLEVMPDNQEPLIDAPKQTPPENVQPHQNVSVRVNVTDYESGVRNVTLYYRVNNGNWEAKPMIFNPTTGLFETIIEGCNEGTKVEYMIIAYDNAGNKAQLDNAGQYYAYTVIPEFPPTTILLLLILVTFIAAILKKKKIKS